MIWLLAIGEGAAKAETEIMELGANNLILSSKRLPEEERSSKGAYFYSYGLTENDYHKISQIVPNIGGSFPTSWTEGRCLLKMRSKSKCWVVFKLSRFTQTQIDQGSVYYQGRSSKRV